MRSAVKMIVNLYNMDNYDWMHYEISSNNPFSYHHLFIPSRKGGKTTVKNGAVLCQKSSHPYIHIIEARDPERYENISFILKEVNLQGFFTTPEQYKKLDDILTSFEREYSSTSNTNGEPLIKQAYTIRGIHD